MVHARGAGAHGYFEAYGKIGSEPASKYTRARVLNETGVKTPMFVRFSTVAGAKESPETERDPRGFAVKFKTVDGNWDLVGNNLKVFFIRDAIKFPDMIHAFKPDPMTNRQEAWRFFDFVGMHPESLHMVTHLKSPWGIPANYREMEGSGVNTYKLINAEGVAHLCKFHWTPKQGVRNLTTAQAREIQAKDVGHSTRDLYDNIAKGNFPEWEFAVQIMPDGPNDHLSFDPLDDTKLWPVDQFPLLPCGRMVLDRAPVQLLRGSRAVGLRHGRAGRRHRLLGRQDAAGPDAVLFGYAALPGRRQLSAIAHQRAAARRSPHDQPARRPDDLHGRRWSECQRQL